MTAPSDRTVPCVECGTPVTLSVVVTPAGRGMGLQLDRVTCRACDAAAEAKERAEEALQQLRAQALKQLNTPPLFATAAIADTKLLGSPESQARINRAVFLASKVVQCTVYGLRPPLLVAFIGPPGGGKTRLLYAIGNELAGQHGRSCRVVKLSALIRDLRASWRSKEGPDEDARLRGYTEVQYLGIDEVSSHAFYGQQIHQHLWDVINTRLEHERPTVITSNETPDGLAAILGPAISSRLKLGGLVQFPDEDFRDRQRASWADEMPEHEEMG